MLYTATHGKHPNGGARDAGMCLSVTCMNLFHGDIIPVVMNDCACSVNMKLDVASLQDLITCTKIVEHCIRFPLLIGCLCDILFSREYLQLRLHFFTKYTPFLASPPNTRCRQCQRTFAKEQTIVFRQAGNIHLFNLHKSRSFNFIREGRLVRSKMLIDPIAIV